MKNRFSFELLAALLGLAMTPACSMDIIPMSKGRVKAAKLAEQPLLRGPDAPGSFRYSWNFQPTSSRSQGYLFDPGQITISKRLARMNAQGTLHEAMMVAHEGPPFVALDSITLEAGSANRGSFRVQLSPNDSSWYFFDGARWSAGGPHSAQANTIEYASAHIGDFHTQVSSGQLALRIFFISTSGKEPVELKSVTVSGIAPRVDSD